MQERHSIKDGDNEWTIDIDGKDVVLHHWRGPFGLHVGQVRIHGGCAATVAKAITAVAKQTKPKRTAARR